MHENPTEFATDWLSSQPIFFNRKTMSCSSNIHDVIDYSNFEFSPEGLKYYLDFGYSCFGLTPIKHVEFLLPNQKLRISKKSLDIFECNDPYDTIQKNTLNEIDLFEKIQATVQSWQSQQSSVVLPLSGGFDSRLLAICLRPNLKVDSFSYGLSSNQSNSTEVLRAKHLSKILGFNWQRIELANFHSYLKSWIAQFGCSTHAHGMYQQEFFEKVSRRTIPDSGVLSGIVGDLWAGSIPPLRIASERELSQLFLTHGLNSDSRNLVEQAPTERISNFYYDNREKLKDPRFQIISMVRFKMMLLSYLLRVPRLYGFSVWSPFLNPEIALSMLNLPQHRRTERRWQQELFEKFNVLLENLRIGGSNTNRLNHLALKTQPPTPLNAKLLSEIVNKNYIEEINRKLTCRFCVNDFMIRIFQRRGTDLISKQLGLKDKRLQAYRAYLTILPLQDLLERRT